MKKFLIWLNQKMELLSILFVAVFALLYFLPFFVRGENSLISIHDYLDSIVAYTKMFHDNGLFYQIDTPMPVLNGISTCFYTFVNFGAYNFLMNYCGPYWGHVIHHVLFIVLSYVSMVTLLRYFWKENHYRPMIRLIAVAYAILPVIPNVALAYATLPFMVFLFLKIENGEGRVNWKYLGFLLYPFFSSFYMVGIFVYGFWLFGIIVCAVRKKKINWGLVAALLLMVIGTVVVDLKLFYTMFWRQEPLNRSIFDLSGAGFLASWKEYFINGYYHAASLQRKIVLPVCVAGFAWLFIKKRNTKTWKAAIGILGVIVVFCAVGAFYDTGILEEPIKQFFPMLDGFNWGRIFLLNRLLWYVLFYLILQEFLQGFYTKWIVYAIVGLQIVYIYQAPVMYNDSYRNMFYQHTIETEDAVSFAEFYSPNLFEKIKEDLDYQGEEVAALGYHPSVLMYNGFHTVDGYMSFYPLEYMVEFRKLIAPELERNEAERAYFDSWGGRMYLYNSEVDYNPTRVKSDTPVNCYIDAEVFRQMGGTYLLSRVPVKNADELEMSLVEEYVGDEWFYNMYVYKMETR